MVCRFYILGHFFFALSMENECNFLILEFLVVVEKKNWTKNNFSKKNTCCTCLIDNCRCTKTGETKWLKTQILILNFHSFTEFRVWWPSRLERIWAKKCIRRQNCARLVSDKVKNCKQLNKEIKFVKVNIKSVKSLNDAKMGPKQGVSKEDGLVFGEIIKGINYH